MFIHSKNNFCFTPPSCTRNIYMYVKTKLHRLETHTKFEVKSNARKIPEAYRIKGSSCVHLSHCARICAPFAFRVRSPFSVHISFTDFRLPLRHHSLCVCSAFVQPAFTVHSSFALRSVTVQAGK